ncbi:MAG: hypothetical protein R2709_13925 [Marmoricola sp.]
MANLLQSGVASAERVFELLDAPEESLDPSDEGGESGSCGEVRFDHVRFSYDPNRPRSRISHRLPSPGTPLRSLAPRALVRPLWSIW